MEMACLLFLSLAIKSAVFITNHYFFSSQVKSVYYLQRININTITVYCIDTSSLKCNKYANTGLSVSFEAGVTLKISPVTCKYKAKCHVNEGPKGLSP